jgi:hypothetical protein
MSLLSKLYGKAKDAKDEKSDDKPHPLWHPSNDWYDGPTGQALKDIVETLLLSLRSVPEALDGYYDSQLDPKTESRDRNIAAKLNDLLAPYVSKEAKPAISAKIAVSCSTKQMY